MQSTQLKLWFFLVFQGCLIFISSKATLSCIWCRYWISQVEFHKFIFYKYWNSSFEPQPLVSKIEYRSVNWTCSIICAIQILIIRTLCSVPPLKKKFFFPQLIVYTRKNNFWVVFQLTISHSGIFRESWQFTLIPKHKKIYKYWYKYQ